MTPSLMIQWKLGCRNRKQKWKNQPIAKSGIEHCHWFILPLLLATPTMQFSLDRKQRRCCSSIFTFGTKFFEPVQNFLNQFKFFEPVQIFQTKKSFWHLRSSLHPPSSFYLHSTYLTYYSLPALPTSQPLFFLSQCLHVPCEPWTTYLWFSFGFMSWCLTIEPWKLECKFHYFFNYIYSRSNKFP